MKTLFVCTLLFFLIFSTKIFPQWEQQNSGTTNRLLTCFFLDENAGWAAGYDGTLLETSDGGNSWISKNIGTLDDIHDIFFINSMVGWAILYEFSPFRHGSIINTTDGGNSWNVQLNIWDYTFHSIFFTDENNGWVAGSNGIVFHTSNGGVTWFQQYPPTGDAWLWPIFFIDNNIGWTAGDPLLGLYKSTNGGNTWISYPVPVVERIHSLVFLDNQSGFLCGTQGQIAKSTNGGMTWQIQQSGTTATLREIFFFDINIGWCVGYNGTILQTLDGGTTWTQQNSGTTSHLFGVQFADETNGWVVGDRGIILKTANGGVPVELTSFIAESLSGRIQLKWSTATEINNVGFEVERCFKNSEWIIIGFVEGKGSTTEIQHYIFIDDLFSVNSEIVYYRLKQIDYDGQFQYSFEIEISIPPAAFNLEQNYPNPFNPTTTINYQISELSFVTLKIYDALGNELVTLISEEKPAGNYEIEFNAANIPSGIYFYTLTAGNFIQTKKLVLLK